MALVKVSRLLYTALRRGLPGMEKFAATFDTKKVISERKYLTDGYVVRKELVDVSEVDDEEPELEMTRAYTPSGDYIGEPRDARRLCRDRGIAPEKISSGHCACSIGFSRKNGKWYGWSHRAIAGFKVGDKVTKNNAAYKPKKGVWTAKNIDDAKQMAIDFAEGVS